MSELFWHYDSVLISNNPIFEPNYQDIYLLINSKIIRIKGSAAQTFFEMINSSKSTFYLYAFVSKDNIYTGTQLYQSAINVVFSSLIRDDSKRIPLLNQLVAGYTEYVMEKFANTDMTLPIL